MSVTCQDVVNICMSFRLDALDAPTLYEVVDVRVACRLAVPRSYGVVDVRVMWSEPMKLPARLPPLSFQEYLHEIAAAAVPVIERTSSDAR